MNLIPCHELMKDTNTTVILVCRNWQMEYYLTKGFLILEQRSKNLSSLPNKEKQRIHTIDMHDSEYVMDCYTSIRSVGNTIKETGYYVCYRKKVHEVCLNYEVVIF